jgi:hypothetical protein
MILLQENMIKSLKNNGVKQNHYTFPLSSFDEFKKWATDARYFKVNFFNNKDYDSAFQNCLNILNREYKNALSKQKQDAADQAKLLADQQAQELARLKKEADDALAKQKQDAADQAKLLADQQRNDQDAADAERLKKEVDDAWDDDIWKMFELSKDAAAVVADANAVEVVKVQEKAIAKQKQQPSTVPTTTSAPITVNPTQQPQNTPTATVTAVAASLTAAPTSSASNTANTTSFQHAERSAYWDYHKSTDSVYTKDHFGGQYDHGVTEYVFQQIGEKNQSGQQNIALIAQDDQQGGEKTMTVKEFLQDLTGQNGVMTTDKKSIPEITTVSAVKKSKSELKKSLKRSIPLLKKRVSKNPRTAALAHQTKQQKFYQIRDQNPSGQQNIALIAQDDQQGGEKTMTVKEFLQDLTGQNGVMMAAKKSIPKITSMSDVRKSKSELEKLMKRVELLFKKRVSKNPRTAALAHQTKQQNQWVTSVNNWLTTLNQADKSANRLTINPTEEHIILELSERKAIIKGFSGLLKDLNQQSKNILKANRDKKLEKQAQLRAKKESERLNKKSVSKKAPMESFGEINKGGSHRARRLDHLSAT